MTDHDAARAAFELGCGDGSDEACDLKEGRVDAAYLRRVQVSAWNAALDAALAKMPDIVISARLADEGRGWNRAISAADDRIRALRSPPSQPGQPSERGTEVEGG